MSCIRSSRLINFGPSADTGARAVNKPPYFPFYVRDFVSDGLVEAMTTREVGAYILLLAKAWLEEPAGSIPNNDTVLARWARLGPADWTECRAAVLAPFDLGADDRWHQKRMRQEYARCMAALKAKSKGGKKGAAKRWGRKDLGGHAWDSHSIPNGRTMASGSDSIPKEEEKKTKKTKRGGGVGEGPETVPIPPNLDVPDFRAAWTEWIAHRRETNKPFTVRAAKIALPKMAGWGPQRAIEAIQHSIVGGYQGIFEAKNGKPAPTASDAEELAEEDAARRQRTHAEMQAREAEREMKKAQRVPPPPREQPARLIDDLEGP